MFMIVFVQTDSKTLTEEQREEIFGKISEAGDILGWMIEILSPAFISNGMLSRFTYYYFLCYFPLSFCLFSVKDCLVRLAQSHTSLSHS